MEQVMFVFGNPDINADALPLRLLPELRERFPNIVFQVLDPNEEWEVPRHILVLDTVVNAKEITTFDSLDAFMAAPRMTCHDFDAYANLTFLKKLGHIDNVTVIGLPPHSLEQIDRNALYKAIESALGKEY